MTAKSKKHNQEILQNLIDELCVFGEFLQKNSVLRIEYLIALCELRELAKKNQITHSIIEKNTKIMVYSMIECFPLLKNQLRRYWNIWQKIFEIHSPKPIRISNNIDKEINKIQEIDSNYQIFLKEQSEGSFSSFHALLLSHLSKTEKLEYNLMKDVSDCLISDVVCDLEEIFSVGGKVPNSIKNSKHVTHARALRDAISHNKYRMPDKTNPCIVFENHDFGYNFINIFSIDEFLNFLKNTDMLYRIMYMMQELMKIGSILHEEVDRLKK